MNKIYKEFNTKIGFKTRDKKYETLSAMSGLKWSVVSGQL